MFKRFEQNQMDISKFSQEIRDMISQEYHKSIISKTTLDPYYQELMIINATYTKNMNGTLEPIIFDLIKPIQDASYNHLTNADSREFLLLCQNAEDRYKKIFDNKRLILESVEHWNKFYLEIKDTISKMIDIEFTDFNYKEEIFIIHE